MKKVVKIIIIVAILTFGGEMVLFETVNAQIIYNYTETRATSFGQIDMWSQNYTRSGYRCVEYCKTCNAGRRHYICTKETIRAGASYGASKEDYRTLRGYANNVTYIDHVTLWELYTVPGVGNFNTPFLYLHNSPEGKISVNIDSEKDTYLPKPHFNRQNGWLVESQDGKLSVNGEKQEHLFYELATSRITVNRNGKNFSSKVEVIDYLNNSDFLTKLGFSEEEKKNSLAYFIPKLQESKDQSYYYLTILSDKAINDISQITVDPQAHNIIRQYFAVYPTPVPVKTEGGFSFPKNKETNGFTVKETGEFLIEEPMQVFFE